MKLDDGKDAVDQRDEEHRHAQVPPIVKQRQEPAVQAAQRTDTQDQRKQYKRKRAKGSNEERLGRCSRVEQCANSLKIAR